MSAASLVMSTSNHDVWALSGLAVVISAMLVRLLLRWRPSVGAWMVLMLTVALVATALWPSAGFGDARLTWAAHLRGITGDFSTTTVVVAAGWLLWRQPTAPMDRHALALLSVVVGAGLIGLQLGSDRFDLYRLGYGAGVLVSGVALAAALSAWRGFIRTALALALSLVVWSLGWPESQNLWDSLLDPWWVLWCAGVVSTALLRSVRRRRL